MDDLTKGLIEHLKKSDPGLEVIETPQFISINDFHPMPNDRDTKFAGFAKLVVQELLGLRYQTVYYNDPQMLETYERIIAQRAYDLALCVIADVFDHIATGGDQFEAIKCVDDLTEWPTLWAD